MAAVTVFVPTWNRPEMLGEAISSALAQTFDDFVVLVGDNGGSPRTEGVVESFGDPRVRYVRHPRNLGGMGNWLELVRQADTPVVASLHDDDVWEPTFLEKVATPLLDDPTLSLSFSDYWCMDDDGARLVEHSEWLSDHSRRRTLRPGRFEGTPEDGLRMVVVDGAPQPAYAAAIRRSAVLDTAFPPEIDPIYDLWLAYRIMRRGEGLNYVPERLTNYRVWSGSVTAAGYGQALDAVLGHIVAENITVGSVREEIESAWAADRYRRGWNRLDDPSAIDYSRAELRRAAPGLSGARWLLAETAARSSLGWRSMSMLRRGVRAVRNRLEPDGLDTSGLPEKLTRPSEDAKRLAV